MGNISLHIILRDFLFWNILQLQKSYKSNTEFSTISFNVNVLHNYNAIIKSKKLTSAQRC